MPNDLINKSDAMIDSFMRGRYPVDLEFSDVPDIISDISTKLTAYKLYGRKLILTLNRFHIMICI
jgi:phage gp36-like protein